MVTITVYTLGLRFTDFYFMTPCTTVDTGRDLLPAVALTMPVSLTVKTAQRVRHIRSALTADPAYVDVGWHIWRVEGKEVRVGTSQALYI